MINWRLGEKIIRTVNFCSVLCTTVVPNDMRTFVDIFLHLHVGLGLEFVFVYLFRFSIPCVMYFVQA